MSDIHIDDFYRDTARILVSLYNQFPRNTTLYVEDIAGTDKPDEFGLHSPRHLACFHTILWLAHTDYVRYESLIRQEAVDQIVLSHRAFLLLSSVLPNCAANHEHSGQLPAAVAEQEYLIINRIRRELKDGTSFSLAALMRQTLAQSRQFS
jgi:hypothetical protein